MGGILNNQIIKGEIMNLEKEILEIKNYFNNLSIEEFETVLERNGIDEISASVNEIIYINKRQDLGEIKKKICAIICVSDK